MSKNKAFLKPYFLLSLIFALGFSLHAQTFPCDGSFYISLNNDASPTVTYDVNYDGTTVAFDNLMVTNLLINATGYNVKDNYIYAASRASNEIVRLFSDGSFEIIGEESTLPIWNTGAGDCSPDGRYVVHERANNTLYFYNVTSAFSLETSVQLTWAASSGNSGVATIDLDDIAFDPRNPKIIYTYQRNYGGFGAEPVATRGALLKINGDIASAGFGEIEVVGIIPDNIIIHLGALFFDSFGDLYGYGAKDNISFTQDQLILIDKQTADATFISAGPGASGNDGCSCPFSVELEKAILSLDINCDSTSVIYELTLYNNSSLDLTGLSFVDILPAGGTIASIGTAKPLGGDIVLGTGIGQSNLRVDNISIGSNSSVSFLLGMEMATAIGSYSNQAEIEGLPSLFNTQVISDDPNTFSFEDPTTFTINVSNFPGNSRNEITAAICADEVYTINGVSYNAAGTYTETIFGTAANGCDSIIELSLSILPDIESFIAVDICTGTSYQINNTLYSTPGIHTEIVANGAVNGCDSIIILDLMFSDTLYSNMTVSLCAEESFMLNGQVYEETGIYDIFYLGAALGGCDSILVLDLFIDEEFVVDIQVTPVVCFGDLTGSILIDEVIGGTAPYLYALNGENFQEENNFVNLPAGVYSLVVEDQDGCQTTFENIVVESNSPELLLFAGQSDFAVELGDEIHLEAYANFQVDSIRWSPSEGLTCTNCLDPDLIPLHNEEYTLTAFDEYGCSAAVLFRVGVTKSPDLFVPNAFSPNGDGANDRVYVFADKSVKEILDFHIYSRWGEEVYHASHFLPNDLSVGWDGSMKNKPMSPGVFAYYLEALCIDGQRFFQKGDIVLIK